MQCARRKMIPKGDEGLKRCCRLGASSRSRGPRRKESTHLQHSGYGIDFRARHLLKKTNPRLIRRLRVRIGHRRAFFLRRAIPELDREPMRLLLKSLTSVVLTVCALALAAQGQQQTAQTA